MRFNINTLQELAYTGTSSDMQTYSDRYLKQALANLGQRFSIKGDGVTNGKFAIYELMPELPVPINGDFDAEGKLYDAYMMATVVGQDDETVDISLTAYCVKDGDWEYYSKSIKLSEDDYVITEEPHYMPGAKVQSANTGAPIAYYGIGGLISSPSRDRLKTAFEDLSSSREPLDCSFNDYDIDYNRVLGGVRAAYYATQTHGSECLLTYIKYVDTSYQYEVALYKLEENGTDDAWQLIMDTNGPILSYKYGWNVDSIISALDGKVTLVGEGLIEETPDGLPLFDSDNLRTIIPDDDYRNIVEANIQQWNESVFKELPLMRSIYNEEVYFGTDDNLKLKKRLCAEIFASLYRNYVIESNGEGTDIPFVCLLPYDYEFIYTCNSQKTEQIYSSSRDLTVEAYSDPLQKLWRIRQEGVDGVREQLIICLSWADSDTTEDIYSIWKYFISYDSEDVVDSICVIRMYIMPYINDDGYWNINGEDTSIYARGKDGGQPSVIISYSDTYSGVHEILSTMHKDELTTALDWESTYFRVRPLDTSTTVGSESFHMMTTYMPANVSTSYLADNLVTFLENAIILDVASVHGEDVTQTTTSKPLADNSELGPNATVTTFWSLTKDEQNPEKYYFSYVKQPATSWAVDFNYLADAEAIVRYYMQLGFEPDLFRHSWLVFDGVDSTLKNQVDPTKKSTAYPTLINRMRESFTDMFDAESSSYQYLNNLNFMMAFYNDVEFRGSYITAVNDENDGRFFHFDKQGTSYTVPVIPTFYRADTRVMSKDYMLNTRETNTTYEGTWWLDTLLPMIDLKETFLRNINTLNRYNIISPNASGELFYSYIGTVYDDDDKARLHIGTSNEDINLGLKTLTTVEERTKFKKHRELDIDFEKVLINGDTVTPEHFWTLDEHNGKILFSSLAQLDYASAARPADYETINDVCSKPRANRDKLFRVEAQVSDSIPDIGNGISVSAKTTYVSYVNVNWLLQDVFYLDSMTDTNMKNGNATVTGEPGRLFTYVDETSVPTYFYMLSEDIMDVSQILDDKSIYYLSLSPIALSYMDDYNTGRSRVMIKEMLTNTSTVFASHDGGELDWEE